MPFPSVGKSLIQPSYHFVNFYRPTIFNVHQTLSGLLIRAAFRITT